MYILPPLQFKINVLLLRHKERSDKMAIDLNLRAELPEDALVFDNFSYDGAIIGYTTDGKVVYDYDKMVVELMEDEGWSDLEAIEWIDYNTIRSIPYAGEKAPIIMYNVRY